MEHKIARKAQASKPREAGRTAVNLKGDRLVKRISGPTELPVGTVVIEATGDYMRRTKLDRWDHLAPNGKTIAEGEVRSALELKYPLVVVDMKATHNPRPNRAARRAEAQDDRRTARATRRFKNRRVAEFLKASSPEERARYAAAGATKGQGTR